MAFVNFNHSANFSTALTNSKTSTNTLYFPSDYPTIIKNGKVFGIKSCTGPLSFNASTGVLSHSNSGVTASYYGQSANVSPSHGGTFIIPYINVNATGHITSASNKTITLPKELSESYLTWGYGRNIAGDISPVDMALDGEFSTNRLSFMPASNIDIEFSRDGGTTWYTYPNNYTDAGTTNTVTTSYTEIEDSLKRKIVTSGFSGLSLYLGSRKGNQTANDQLRITITAANGNLYFGLKKILIYYCMAYGSGNYCTVEKCNCGSTTFTEVGKYSVSGWSGWNSIPYVENFGGSDTQTSNVRKIRLTFGVTGVSSTTNTNIMIQKIRMYGGTLWSNANGSLSGNNHMYTWDIDKNVTFPAKVNATEYLQNNTPLTSIFYNATVSRTKNTVLAAPSTGNGTASFRKLVIGDLPTGTTASTVALGNHTHSNYLTAVTSSNHYKPTVTNTIVPETSSSYGSFGTSMYINSISVDDNGHIIYVHGNRLPKNPNTHYTTKLTIGNKASFNNTNTNYTNATYLNVFDDNTCRSSISIKGDGSIDTKADASGNLIISSNRYITNSSTNPLLSLSPNETVVCTNKVDSITISTFNTKSNYPIEHYKVVFNTSYSFGNISYNSSLNIKWANNEIPSKTFNILPNKIYEMDFESVTIGGTKTIKGCLTYFG